MYLRRLGTGGSQVPVWGVRGHEQRTERLISKSMGHWAPSRQIQSPLRRPSGTGPTSMNQTSGASRIHPSLYSHHSLPHRHARSWPLLLLI